MIQQTPRGEVLRYDLAADRSWPMKYWTTCYRLGDTMIDTGASHAAKDLLGALRRDPPARVLLTHCHEDHVGGVGDLRAAFGALAVHGHPGTLAVLADPRGKQPQQLYRRVFWGWPRPADGGLPLADGDVVEAPPYRFVAIHTPGHSPDHLCFHEPDRGWVFTGDLYVGGRDRAIRTDADAWQIVASLQRILALDPAVMYPGAARIPPEPRDALRTKIAYYREIGGRVMDLHARGWPAGRIARELFGGPTKIEVITGGHFSRRGLVGAFLKSPPPGGGTP